MTCSQSLSPLEARSERITSDRATSRSAVCSNALQTKGSHKHFPAAIDWIGLHAKCVMVNCNYKLNQRL
jgi:hypothetical protein